LISNPAWSKMGVGDDDAADPKEEAMRRCPNCGAQIPDNNRLCAECRQGQAMIVEPVGDSPTRATAKKAALVVGGIAFLILVVLLIILAALGWETHRLVDLFDGGAFTPGP
jgi:hypothetical protein